MHYSIAGLWRYPVKSMAGEELASVDVNAHGLAGDRAYALIDTITNKVGSAKNVKRFGDLLKWRAEMTEHGVRMTMPDGVLPKDYGAGDPAMPASFPEQLAYPFRH